MLRYAQIKMRHKRCEAASIERDKYSNLPYSIDIVTFLFSCPAYSDVRQKHASLFQQAFSVSDFFTDSEPNACGGSVRECFSVKSCLHLTYH